MNKDHTIRNLILFILIFGILGGGGYYYFFMREGNSGGIINTILNNSTTKDVKNGIYIYKNSLGSTTNIYRGCTVSSIDDYIVVINDKYYKYHGSCMVMKYLGEGETSSLKFNKEKEKNYTIELDKKTYNKSPKTREINVGNNIITEVQKANYSLVKYIIKHTEVEGDYYNLNVELTNSTNNYNLSLDYDNNTKLFDYRISTEAELYAGYYNNLKDLPKLYFYNGNLILVDQRLIDNIYRSNIYMYDAFNKTYDFSRSLPLKVNGVQIDNTYNIIPRYDEINKTFYVVFSKDNTFCNTKSDIMYYEFKLNYDFKTNGFKTPSFVKKAIGDKGNPEDNEDCKYIKKYYLKEG